MEVVRRSASVAGIFRENVVVLPPCQAVEKIWQGNMNGAFLCPLASPEHQIDAWMILNRTMIGVAHGPIKGGNTGRTRRGVRDPRGLKTHQKGQQGQKRQEGGTFPLMREVPPMKDLLSENRRASVG